MDIKIDTIEQAITALDKVAAGMEPKTRDSKHSLFWFFNHMAQSVDYSLTGYPLLRPKWIRLLIGKPVFGFFNWVHRMYHDINEPIPGAPTIPEAGDWREGIIRLQISLRHFQSFKGSLKPHFMYGDLSKEQYTKAHLMHIENHFRYMDKV